MPMLYKKKYSYISTCDYAKAAYIISKRKMIPKETQCEIKDDEGHKINIIILYHYSVSLSVIKCT